MWGQNTISNKKIKKTPLSKHILTNISMCTQRQQPKDNGNYNILGLEYNNAIHLGLIIFYTTYEPDMKLAGFD